MKKLEKRVTALEQSLPPPPLGEWDSAWALLTGMARRLKDWRLYHRTMPPHSYAHGVFIMPDERACLEELLTLAQTGDDEEAGLAARLCECVLAELPVREPGADTSLPGWWQRQEREWTPTWLVWAASGTRGAYLGEWQELARRLVGAGCQRPAEAVTGAFEEGMKAEEGHW